MVGVEVSGEFVVALTEVLDARHPDDPNKAHAHAAERLSDRGVPLVLAMSGRPRPLIANALSPIMTCGPDQILCCR
jgi:hypothetical protein